MYSLEDVFIQGENDRATYGSSYAGKRCLLKLGIMLNKFPNSIEILNTSRGGDHYKELTEEEYKFFFENGWEKGVLLTSMGNYLRKLNMIEDRIQEEINTRKNDKHIQGLKVSREKILQKYSLRKQQIINLHE